MIYNTFYKYFRCAAAQYRKGNLLAKRASSGRAAEIFIK